VAGDEPKVGSRWKSKATKLLYEIADPEDGPTPKPGYAKARLVSSATDRPIGGIVSIPVPLLGVAYVAVKAKS
jgi:hypothetical protein